MSTEREDAPLWMLQDFLEGEIKDVAAEGQERIADALLSIRDILKKLIAEHPELK